MQLYIHKYPHYLKPYFDKSAEGDSPSHSIIINNKKTILRLRRTQNNELVIIGCYEPEENVYEPIPNPQTAFHISSTEVEDLDVWLSMHFPYIRDYSAS